MVKNKFWIIGMILFLTIGMVGISLVSGKEAEYSKGKSASDSGKQSVSDMGKSIRNGITMEIKDKFKEDGKDLVSKEVADIIEFDQEDEAILKSEIKGPFSTAQRDLITKLQESLKSATEEIEIEIESEDGVVKYKITGTLNMDQQAILDELIKSLKGSEIETELKIETKKEEETTHEFAVEVLCPLSFDHEVEKDILIADTHNFQIIKLNVKDIPKMAQDKCVGKFGDENALEGITKYAEKKLTEEFIERAKKDKLDETRGLETPRKIKETLDEQLEIEVKQGKLKEMPNVSISPQFFVTPDDATIKLLASGKSKEQIYNYVAKTTWVPDRKLFGTLEFWQLPREFIEDTPNAETNPVRGEPVSDCSEKANTLVSMLRASGVPPENVRAVIALVNFGSVSGHAYVEVLEDGKWLVLDPSSGPFWNQDTNKVVSREPLPYDYFETYPYPVVEVIAKYNDKYYQDFVNDKSNAPADWEFGASTNVGATFESAFGGGPVVNNNMLIIVILVIVVVAYNLGKGKRK